MVGCRLPEKGKGSRGGVVGGWSPGGRNGGDGGNRGDGELRVKLEKAGSMVGGVIKYNGYNKHPLCLDLTLPLLMFIIIFASCSCSLCGSIFSLAENMALAMTP